VKTFLDVETLLRETVPGYQSRPPQQELAATIEMFNQANKHPVEDLGWTPVHLFGQGPVGCGKSYAYLIPMILSGMRVVVSVTTKALQDQLAQTDMPRLVALLEPHLGPIPWCVLKGRQNYFCRAAATSATEALPSLSMVMAYGAATPDWDGTQTELPFDVPDDEWWQMRADSDSCRDASCSPSNGCYAEKARLKATQSRIIVVNHALLATDLQIKATGALGMLGEYDRVVVDEAHKLADVVTNALGGQMTELSFRQLGQQMCSWAHRHAGVTIGEETDRLFERECQGLSALADSLDYAAIDLFGPDGLPLGQGGKALRIRQATLIRHQEQIARLGNALESLIPLWRRLRGALEYVPADEQEKAARTAWWRLYGRLSSLSERFASLASTDPGKVRWVEQETTRKHGKRKVVKIAPLSVAPFLAEHLFSVTPVVLVSATLAVSGRFDFLAARLGIRDYASIVVDSPFDYRRQGRLYLADLPVPTWEEDGRPSMWELAANLEIVDLVRAAGGRTLVLFPSLKHMRSAAEYLREADLGYTVLVQGEAPVGALAARFKAEETSVLFGSESFMTGFDAPGPTCSLVIVVKMMFAPKDDPMTQARCEAIEDAGGNSFFDYLLPTMILTLLQAVGRAIRSVDDIAAVAILDPRISVKNYGKQIQRRDLPPMPQVRSLAEITAFLPAPSSLD
jgi:ATP-dependent DNA helicase DinG